MQSAGDNAFRPQLMLRSSRLFAVLLCALVAAACIGAAVSNLLLPIKALLLCAVLLLSWHIWRQENRSGLRSITADEKDPQQLTLHFANCHAERATYAGYALLGTLAIFIFIERSGWKRIFGARRFAVLRDATSQEDFRRLRAWVRLH